MELDALAAILAQTPFKKSDDGKETSLPTGATVLIVNLNTITINYAASAKEKAPCGD